MKRRCSCSAACYYRDNIFWIRTSEPSSNAVCRTAQGIDGSLEVLGYSLRPRDQQNDHTAPGIRLWLCHWQTLDLLQLHLQILDTSQVQQGIPHP